MSRSILMFTIITLVTIIAWGAFSIFRGLYTTQVSNDVQKNLSPISSSFDKDSLTQIYKRKQ